ACVHRIGKAGFEPREWQFVMDWAEPGKTAVFFHDGIASVVCTGDYWYTAYGQRGYWEMAHGDPCLLRAFAGKTDQLAAAVTELLADREVIVPCLANGDMAAMRKREGRR